MTPTATLPRLSSRRNGTASATPPSVVRVAIYTRKSTEDGLDQEFNSLHAQRQAVEAYVASQRALGWTASPEEYSDGGFSGATTDRPAFQRLLRDVEAGKVDVVAVYKIDRLSRSLLDFTQLMQTFEKRGVEFVSVTQQFSTSTSVGRMTLNLLATFAQFERETISERTRDKIAATRRRGMWTGGRPVLGYVVVDKKLVVEPNEAEQVRAVFELYLELGSLLAVVAELARRGWRNKSFTNRRGELVAGRAFDKSTLRHLLANPLYRGKVTVGDELHDGVHAAIVDEKVFAAVQEQMRAHGRTGDAATRNKWGALLRGVLRCAVCGSAMSHSYASRGTRRWSSYCCLKYSKEGASACPGSRVPLGTIEQFVVAKVRSIGQDPQLVADTVAATRRQLDERRAELESELRRLDTDRRRLAAERARIDGAGRGAATKQHDGRVAELADLLGRVDARRVELDDELALLAKGHVDDAEIRDALASFDPVWDELRPCERARVLRLLVEEVRYDGRSGDVAITLRPEGVRLLAREQGGSP